MGFLIQPTAPWAWFNTSYPSQNVTFGLTLCAVSGIPAGSHTVSATLWWDKLAFCLSTIND